MVIGRNAIRIIANRATAGHHAIVGQVRAGRVAVQRHANSQRSFHSETHPDALVFTMRQNCTEERPPACNSAPVIETHASPTLGRKIGCPSRSAQGYRSCRSPESGHFESSIRASAAYRDARHLAGRVGDGDAVDSRCDGLFADQAGTTERADRVGHRRDQRAQLDFV